MPIRPIGGYIRFICTAVLLLSILSGCGQASSSTPLASRGEKTIALLSPTPTPIATFAAQQPCPQQVCLLDSTIPGHKLIDSWNNIHLFQTFSYNMSYSQAQSLANAYDFVWGASISHTAAFHSGNPNIMVSYYLPLNRDAGTFYNPDAARSPGRLNYWKANHPDWILYKCDRVTPVLQFVDPNISLDISNPDVIDWQIQTYALPASQHGYDALAMDNLNLDNGFGACGSYQNGSWVQRYTGQPNDQQWRADMLTYVTALQTKLHALAHPLILISNIGYLSGAPIIDPNTYDQMLQIASHLDGITDEAGFTKYGEGFLTDDNWLATVNFIKKFQEQHKPYYIIDEYPKGDEKSAQLWGLATYLIVKGHSAYLYMSCGQCYGEDRRIPEYKAQIGVPISEMYQEQSVYWRLYSNGLVIVNSSSATPANNITLPEGQFVDLSGHPVSGNLSMDAHSGVVLLKK